MYFMNSMQLKDKVRNISQQKNIDFNTTLRLYMYDRFVERLAYSSYRDNFILKGGFYLSRLFGVENRATMDIDMAISQATFTEENIHKMISEIIEIPLNDNAQLELVDIKTIREQEEYGGYRVTLSVKIENITEKFQIDIATGDPITPQAIEFKYLPTLGDDYISLWAYNIESVLAEKLETILSRGELSTRMRDYYDIYLIYQKDVGNIDEIHLTNAVQNTFKKREYTGNVFETFNIIKNSEALKTRWVNYCNKNKYAKTISYEEVIICLKKFIEIIASK